MLSHGSFCVEIGVIQPDVQGNGSCMTEFCVIEENEVKSEVKPRSWDE